jgi:DNA helicase II / ATP-dependent DNA helicase PcrA
MAWNDNLGGPALQFAASLASRLRTLAGPGTGKTYALVRRVARLLEEGHDPDRILVVTFARTAAQDLLRALQKQEGARAGEVGARTLHSLCFSIVSSEGVLQATGRVPRIVLDFERDILLYDLEGNFGTVFERRRLVRAFEAAWARLQTEHPGEPVEGLDQHFQDSLLEALRWYEAMLIGEVVPLALNYLALSPQAPERIAYDHVLVDEYQDLNRAEQVVIDLLSERSQLTVIGDDDQSIYRFKSANPDGIRTFTESHPGTQDIEFVECRRCPRLVVEMARNLIERNPGRARTAFESKPGKPEGEIHHVQWSSIGDEAQGIAQFVATAVERGIDPGQCLILAPVRDIGYPIRDAIRARNIEIRSFFREEPLDTPEAQEALTLLTLLGNPADRLALRAWLALGSPTRRRKAYLRTLDAARQQNTDVAEVMRRLSQGDIELRYTSSLLERWRQLQRRLVQLDSLRDDLPALVDRVLPEDQVGDPDIEDPLGLLREIALAAAEKAKDAGQLASMIRYRISQPEVPLETPYARVMSLHKSKGLTAQLVVLAGLVGGLIPRIDHKQPPKDQRESYEEQRRLFFVGITRTTKILVFSSYSQLDDTTAYRLRVPHGRRFGRNVLTVPSPFLAELGPLLPRAIRGEAWHY